MEYLPVPFEKVANNPFIEKSESEILLWFHDIARGLEHLHLNWVIHRDLSIKNIMLAPDGRCKIIDFGMSPILPPLGKPMSRQVTTIHYRAPEVCLGSNIYSQKIDIWALGCIMAELYLNKPLFQANHAFELVKRIFSIRGTPNFYDNTTASTLNEWPMVESLPHYAEFPPTKPVPLRKVSA